MSFNVRCPQQCNSRKRKTRRLSRKRVIVGALLLAIIGAHANASAPNATIYEDCSIAPNASATQSERDAFATFNAIPDAQRVQICELINPDFLERFAN